MKSLLLAALLQISLIVSAHSADKLTVLLDWFVNPDHAPLIVADEAGFFEREGLDVEMIAPADPSTPPKFVAAGQGDIAISYQPSLHFHIQEKLPLVRIGTLVETPLNTLVALADGPIKSIADLKGKTVGFSVGGFEDALLGEMLKAEGLSLSDVTLVNVNFALTPALVSGQVDAVIGAFRNFELTQLEIAGKKGIAFYPEENGVPVYDELIFVSKRPARDDTRFARFLAAIEAATIYLTNNPDEAWKLFIKAHPNLDDRLNQQAWVDTLPRFAKRPAALDVGRYERFGAFMKERGLIDTIPAVSDMAITVR